MSSRILIGVAGGTGSGKTTVASKIGEVLHKEMVIIPQDFYYGDNNHLPLEEREKINYDHPDSFDTELLVEHLKNLVAGETIQSPIYDFKEHKRREETKEIKPAPIIILEGILIFVNPALREIMDFKIFVDTPSDIRLIRRIKRDMVERGRTLDSVINQYLETVRPMYERFVLPTRDYSDLVTRGEGDMEKALQLVLQEKLR